MFQRMIAGISTLGLAAVLGAAVAATPASAAEYPLLKPKEQPWSFAGLFGSWDQAQLQRGLKVYTEVCSACHSMNYIYFRNLTGLGFTDEQVKAFASTYEVTDGPNSDGEMFQRPGQPTDQFPAPYPNVQAAKAANNGAYPPDQSLIAKARAPERGFPTFIFDIFTMYAENGPDYLYSLLTGYGQQPPEGLKVQEGLHYNPYFVAGSALAMAQPIQDGQVSYPPIVDADGNEIVVPETVDQYARDVSAFLAWAAEPTMVERKQRGFLVLLFLIILAGLLYFTKKKVWADVTEPEVSNPK